MALVKGNNAVLQIQYGGEYLPYACVQEVTLTETTELIPTTTGYSKEFRTFRGRLSEWKVGLSGIFHLPVTGKVTAFLLFNTTVRQQGLLIKIIYTDIDGALQTIAGRVLFPSKAITTAAGQLGKDTIEMQGSGPYLLTGVVTGGEEPGGVDPGGGSSGDGLLDMDGMALLDMDGQAILDL